MPRRKVSDEEDRLLQHAMKDVRPLKPRAKARKGRAKIGAIKVKPQERHEQSSLPLREGDRGRGSKAATLPQTPPFKGSGRKQSSAADIDRRTEQKLKRGRMDIEAVLDLHGLKQEAAHRRLNDFIARTAAEGHKAVLIITGKGAARAGERSGFMPSERRGVLRSQVPLWLEQPPLRALVIGTKPAGPRHGGSGALYVLLRRPKRG